MEQNFNPIPPQRTRGERIPRLTIQEAKRDKEATSLWVLNTAATFGGLINGGVVYVSVNRKDGDPVILDVPNTWLPFDLAERAPREEIMASTKFLQAVTSGLLSIISEEAALVMLEDPNAEAERSRLNQQREVVKAATASRGIGRNVTISVGDDSARGDGGAGVQRANVQQPAISAPSVPAPKAHRQPFFSPDDLVDFSMSKANASTEIDLSAHLDSLAKVVDDEIGDDLKTLVTDLNGMDEADARQQLILRRSKVTKSELNYIATNITHSSIRKWGQMMLDQVG